VQGQKEKATGSSGQGAKGAASPAKLMRKLSRHSVFDAVSTDKEGEQAILRSMEASRKRHSTNLSSATLQRTPEPSAPLASSSASPQPLQPLGLSIPLLDTRSASSTDTQRSGRKGIVRSISRTFRSNSPHIRKVATPKVTAAGVVLPTTANNISSPSLSMHHVSIDKDFNWITSKDAFVLQRKLGSGAASDVYLAKHQFLPFQFAVKILRNCGASKELENEISIMKKCHHRNILQYYGCFKNENETWMIMDYSPRGSVKDLMLNTGVQLGEVHIAKLLHGVLSGLAFLHSKDIVHADIKSANILLTDAFEPRLADFGISLVSGAASAGQGTLLSMAPECLSSKTFTAKSDIWAIGILAIELAEIHPPLFFENIARVMYIILFEDPPFLEHPDKWSAAFQSLIRVCLQKEEAARPTCTDLLEHQFVKNVECTKKHFDDLLSPPLLQPPQKSTGDSSPALRIKRIFSKDTVDKVEK